MGKALARRQPLPPALVTTSLAKLEEVIGGREALVAALAHAPKTKDLEYVLGLVGDPSHARTPLAHLCAMGGITAGELIDAFKAGELNRAQALSMRAIGEGLPAVVQDTFRLAAPYEGTCFQCRGTGTSTPEPSEEEPNPSPGPCERCQGLGKLQYQGDLEHKKLALDLGKMTSKGGGVQVGVQVDARSAHLHLGAAGGALELLQAATDRVLYGGEVAPGGPGPVQEAEIVPPGTDPPTQEDTYP